MIKHVLGWELFHTAQGYTNHGTGKNKFTVTDIGLPLICFVHNLVWYLVDKYFPIVLFYVNGLSCNSIT